jgi:hypothetical protein
MLLDPRSVLVENPVTRWLPALGRGVDGAENRRSGDWSFMRPIFDASSNCGVISEAR